MKRLGTLILALLLSMGLLGGCAGKEGSPAAPEQTAAEASHGSETGGQAGNDAVARFTDSAGREVEVPADIGKVAVSGPLAQIAVFALCPDNLAGLAEAWDAVAEQYIDREYYDLPELGQLYGGKGELNLETLLSSGAQVVIDVGESKATVAEDLDALQEQTGLPFVHITATLDNMGGAYRQLGRLLGMENEAEALAAYCDEVYERMLALAGRVEKAQILYCLGDEGLNVIAKGSYHAQAIDLLADNLAVLEDPSSKGSGNEVDMERLLLWQPDVILFAPDSIYGTVADDPTWQQMAAIRDDRYYEVPYGPYNWLGFPPSAQRYLGMLWMAALLYPDESGVELREEVGEYYRLFYHCELTDGQYDALVANSIGKLR